MDRGFASLKLIQRWLGDGVRFIVRLRSNASYHVIRTLSPARPYGRGRIERDALVRLGHRSARVRPTARTHACSA